jgi:metal-responsive CopG/Arc/MetJ family transcriptional regulator
MKINITVNDLLLEKVDAISEKNFMSRSAFISLCLNEKIKQDEIMEGINLLKEVIKKIKECGNLDEDDKGKIEKFELLANLL